MTKARLLYISPVWPDVRGNGLAMRAGMMLEALAQQHEVYLLVAEFYGERSDTALRFVQRCCVASDSFLPALPAPQGLLSRLRSRPRPAGPPASRTVVWQKQARAFPGVDFDTVHVFRLYVAHFAEPYLRSRSRPRLHLDLDDLESKTRADLAALYRRNGAEAEAAEQETEARDYEALERRLLPTFDRVYVASEGDRGTVTERYGCRTVRVAPNAVRLPEVQPGAPATDRPFTFLFVGTLGYYPNEDGLLYFCREVLPLLRELAPRTFRLHIVGANAGREVQRLGVLPEVEVIGAVPDVTNFYGAADAVVVPVRGGGGTRIKVLEAFAFGRPVVATSLGIEGIEAGDGEQVLLADTPQSFALACVRLMSDAGVGAGLASRALALVRERYSAEALFRAVTAD